jgi:hypothetical protein
LEQYSHNYPRAHNACANGHRADPPPTTYCHPTPYCHASERDNPTYTYCSFITAPCSSRTDPHSNPSKLAYSASLPVDCALALAHGS